jgi:hypothetical protein
VLVRLVPSWTTRVLLTRGVDVGRVPLVTVPRKVSENSHATRPSGSSTDAVLSPPVQCPPALLP